MIVLNAKGLYYRELNSKIREEIATGSQDIVVKNVNGQRYIGDGITGKARLTLKGTPGNDMAAFMNGLELFVEGNTQDSIGNTMNNGKIVVHGSSGDTVGYAMRGGEIYIRGNGGYRVGIHMKEYQETIPAIVLGGKAGDFLGEYMAGGVIVVLGLDLEESEEIVGSYCGTGMHGGVMYIRGEVDGYKLGKEVKVVALTEKDHEQINRYVKDYVGYFGGSYEDILAKPFSKLIPYNKRPYGNLYCGW
ncbi:MAG TPA: hypothetical protein DEF42_13445 [Desulfosporosinus sp.]|nr:hypothetical protein [Desulfosporosinus sp.]